MLTFAINRGGFSRAELVNDIKNALGNQANVMVDAELDEDYIYVRIGEHDGFDCDVVADWWCSFKSKKREAL